MLRRPALVLLLITLLASAGCGGDDASSGTSASASAKPELTVFAAASLTGALTTLGQRYPAARLRFSFAGSDQLAAQVRQGLAPDVIAAANTKIPDELAADGLVERPVTFTANRLVLAVPAGTSKVSSLDDLARAGTTLAIGSASVPVGASTRKVLARLPGDEGDRILANAATQEPDVKGVVGKLTQGAVDAGFVYVTDVQATNGRLAAIDLPASLKPDGDYGVAVVKGTEHPAEARAFVRSLVDGAGQRTLRAAGFEPPSP